jgi:subtilisin family serine protease
MHREPRRYGRRLLSAVVVLVVLAGCSVALAEGPPAGPAPPGAQGYAPGEVIVRYRGGAQRADAREAAGAESAKRLPLARAEVLRLAPGEGVPDAVTALRRRDDVEYAQPNWLYVPESVPNDPLFAQQWALRNTGRDGGTPGADIHAVAAWDVSTGSDSVVIGIVDTGLNVNHPDLAPNVDPRGADLVNNDGDVADDFSEHGTFVASVAAARGDNGLGMSGVAQRARLLALQADNGQGLIKTDAVVAAVAKAKADGARVVNMSFGSYGPPRAGDNAIRGAIESAPGILFTVSAGNQDPATGRPNDNDGVKAHWPSNLSRDHANVISVASTNRRDELSAFSSYGATTVDLGAPGEQVFGARAMTTVYAESFDSVTAPALPTGWTSGGTNNSWGTTSESGASASPPNSLGDSPNASYLPNTDSYATSPPLPVPAGSSACKAPHVRRRALGSSGDHFTVAWEPNAPSGFATIDDRTDGTGGRFEPAAPRIRLAAGVSSVRLRFGLRTGAGPAGDGVEVDNLRLACNHPNPDAFGVASGTSFSAPVVAGAAAVLLGRNPNLTPAELKAAMTSTVDPVPALAGKTVTGGRLNLDRAVRSLSDRTQTAPQPQPQPEPQPRPRPQPSPDTTPPVVSGVGVVPFSFLPLRAGATVGAAAARGARLRFAVSEPATVTVRVLRRVAGRWVGRACIARTRPRPRRAACIRYDAVGSDAVPGVVGGAVSRRLSGRVNGHPLAPGLYRLELVATDAAGNRSLPTTAGLHIARR